jgi:hypothetical protein
MEVEAAQALAIIDEGKCAGDVAAAGVERETELSQRHISDWTRVAACGTLANRTSAAGETGVSLGWRAETARNVKGAQGGGVVAQRHQREPQQGGLCST